MAGLIESSDVLAALPELTEAEQATVPDVILSVGRAFERWCDRKLVRRPALDGSTDPVDVVLTIDPVVQFALPEYPVNEVLRLETNLQPVLEIRQTDSTANQLASVRAVTSGTPETGLKITGIQTERTASGVVTKRSYSFASYPTITALAQAVSVEGWKAEPLARFELWPTANFTPFGVQGALGETPARLRQWITPLDYELDATAGIVTLTGSPWGRSPTTASRFRDMAVHGAHRNVHAVLDVGYDPVPEDLQALAIEGVQAILDRRRSDNTIKAEKVGKLEWTYRECREWLPKSVLDGLNPYRRY